MRRGSLACNDVEAYVEPALCEDVKRLCESNSAYISLGLSYVRPCYAAAVWQQKWIHNNNLNTNAYLVHPLWIPLLWPF